MGRGKNSKTAVNDSEKKQNAVENTPAKPTQAVMEDVEKIEKEYLDILNYERKQRNDLLGNFKENEYVIPDKIKEILIKAPKQFGESDEKVVRVSTRLGEFILNFRIDIEIDESFCKAKLYIIEMESNFDESIKHETYLDELLEPYSLDFKNHIFERWNIKRDESQIEKEDSLKNLLRFQKEEFMFSRELYDVLGQLYIVRMLALLERMGEKGAKIRFDFKRLMGKYLEKGMDFSHDFAMQKRILDILLMKSGMLTEILKENEGISILKGYYTPIKNIRDKTFTTNIEASNLKKEEKKSEKSSTTSTKPKVKKTSPVKSPKTFVFDMKTYKAPSFSPTPMTPLSRTPQSPNRNSQASPSSEKPKEPKSPKISMPDKTADLSNDEKEYQKLMESVASAKNSFGDMEKGETKNNTGFTFDKGKTNDYFEGNVKPLKMEQTKIDLGKAFNK